MARGQIWQNFPNYLDLWHFSLPYSAEVLPCHSTRELRNAVTVSEEKIQEHCRMGPIFMEPFPFSENHQTLAGIAVQDHGISGRNSPGLSQFSGRLLSGTLKGGGGVTEMGVFASACQYIVSLHRRTTKLRATIACQCNSVGTSRRGGIVLSSRSPCKK